MLKYCFDNLLPVDEYGYYGEFGGAYIPDDLKVRLDEVNNAFRHYINDDDFLNEFEDLLHNFAGRETPLFFARKLSERYGATIYLKREDLNHTGAHKLNNALGLGLLAKRMGKHKIIAETGAGQHGVAAATVAALLDLDCVVYMGAEDVERQRPNVMRMKMLGAKVMPVRAGSSTLNNAVDAALNAWCEDADAFYLIGSAVGPHPFPEIVARFQSVISFEVKQQLQELYGRDYPDYVVACIGGGSNAGGAFYHYINDKRVELVAVEAAGKGVGTGLSAASLTEGNVGVLHGSRTKILLDESGSVQEAYSISPGLDYPGIGPLQAYLAATGRTKVLVADDNEAVEAAYMLAIDEGIIPALESSHALAALPKLAFKPEDIVVVILSGRGDKDMETYMKSLEDRL